jgi:hypothetical protein
MICWRSRFSIILALALAACNAQEEVPPGQSTGEPTQAAPGSAAGDPAVVHHPEPPARPETLRDSIQLEGTYHAITARLVKPEGSISFSTYVPEDMHYEMNSSDEGEGHFFYANFAGRKNENAFMLVFLLPPGATRTDAQALGNAFVTSRGGKQRVASVRHGSYNNRVFYVATAYPAEFGDGMGPRTHYIRSRWVWLNDGKSLESTLEPRRE